MLIINLLKIREKKMSKKIIVAFRVAKSSKVVSY